MIILFLFSTSIQVTPDSATVGDSLTATLKGEIIDSISIIIPDSFPDIIILDSLEKEGDSIRRIKFTSFSTGPQDFRVGIRKDTLTGSYFIQSALGPKNKGLSPIWGPYGFFNWHYLLWCLLLPIGLFGYWVIRRRKGEEVFIKEEELEPGEEALKNLKKLEEKVDVWNWNKLYTSLSYTARRYIERKAGIPAVEATTSELLKLIKRGGSRVFSPLASRFPNWDLIKFADEKSNPEVFKEDIKSTRSVVKEMEKEDDSLS